MLSSHQLWANVNKPLLNRMYYGHSFSCTQTILQQHCMHYFSLSLSYALLIWNEFRVSRLHTKSLNIWSCNRKNEISWQSIMKQESAISFFDDMFRNSFASVLVNYCKYGHRHRCNSEVCLQDKLVFEIGGVCLFGDPGVNVCVWMFLLPQPTAEALS